jgi:hypothetical protein
MRDRAGEVFHRNFLLGGGLVRPSQAKLAFTVAAIAGDFTGDIYNLGFGAGDFLVFGSPNISSPGGGRKGDRGACDANK